MNKTDQLPLQISLQKFENFYFNLRGRFCNPMNDKNKAYKPEIFIPSFFICKMIVIVNLCLNTSQAAEEIWQLKVCTILYFPRPVIMLR